MRNFKEGVLNENPWHERGDVNGTWVKMVTCIRKVALKELGVTKGGKCEGKETWWWNEKVQKTVKKKEWFMQLMERCRGQKKDLHIVFIDMDKTYDKVPRNVM
jgi:hypothetical protein